MTRRIALSMLATLFAAAAGPTPAAQQPAFETVGELFDAYYEFRLSINPTEATKLGERRYNDQFANFISDDYRQRLIREYEGFLAAVRSFEGTSLPVDDARSLAVMRWDCEIKKQGLENRLETVASPIYDIPNFRLLPVAQTFSFHLYMSQLAGGTTVQPFATVADYEKWLKRVDGYVGWIDTAIANMRDGIEHGVVWPRIIVQRSIAQLDQLIAKDLREHVYFRPILAMPAAIDGADRQRLTEAYVRMIETKVDPAHRRLRDFLRDEYLPRAGAHTGIGALPGGDAAYRYLIRYHTSTDMTPDQIHELGKREVARIEQEMEAVRKAVGFEGDLRAFFDHVRSNPEQMPFTEPGQVLRNFEAIHAQMQPHLKRLFAVQPIAGFEIRRTEAFRENSASAEYVPGSKDGQRPGIFYVPIPDVRSYNKFADESLFLHEAIPGHHYQLSLQQENASLPEFLHPEGMGVFVEGWALYAESLGRELGLYSDPYQYFGMLSAEMHRAIRLVVDTGMHAMGWTREQAIRYSLDHEAESEQAIVAEVERYMVGPGQALAYKIGQLKIRELRQKAEAELGEAFDVREFHGQV
ncbi:MAG TPA: DUF885 domain-containing protein, partial [Steroidobacteraceae bacterium]|nr:DUF885 domain-containing protein [Steroidobacteraceae bacterium]